MRTPFFAHRLLIPIQRASIALAAVLVLALAGSAHAGGHDLSAYKPFEGEKSEWHAGFDRFDYLMDDQTLAITPFKAPANEKFGVQAASPGKRRCIVVVPKNPAPGNPWSWRGCYWDHEPQTEVELLRRGFHIAFITPDPSPQWDAWYTYLTAQHGLSKRPAFVGMSKGGVNEYEWATSNPDKVSCIYADNPAIRPESFQRLAELANRDVPLLHVCGSEDFLLQRHTLAIENSYHQLGGRITVIIKDGSAHHPHSLSNPKLIADWMERNIKTEKVVAARPDFADDSFIKSYYYSLVSSYIELPEQKLYATCRGPGFVECYDRFDARSGSPWGVAGLAVIVPRTAAPGKPWVFRANALPRDAAVDQALLARGYHIVIAPLTAQSGAVREQWDATYKLMTDHGLSTKPVMEGSGAAAGEAYAWAIENPDKVCGIVAENPVLRSLMVKGPLFDRLDSLAKAHLPVLHECGATDPALSDQTRAIEKRYKELGGAITVIVREGQGHFLSEQRDVTAVADFVVALTPAPRADAAHKPQRRSPDEVLLVYNESSPISKSVAKDYADKRKVKNILAIACVDSAIATENETIPLAAYSEAIEKPIRGYLAAHPEIQFIVLTKGVPIRITGAQTGERDEHSAPSTPLNASVDSHLAAMDYNAIPGAVKIQLTGSGATGVGWANRYWNSNEPFSHTKFGGYLVTRLDGYTEADAKALVSRALAAEMGIGDGTVLLDAQPRFGLGNPSEQPAPIQGLVITSESPWSDYNADLRQAHDVLKNRRIADELDLTEQFIGGRSNLLGYFSWGSNDAKFSNKAYQSLRFAPGSISDTAVSTSARTFLHTQGGQSLMADLIAHGLTCAKGYIDEPLLQACASPTILLDHYTSGYTMAESFYAASHFVGWQDLIIGDPLCCPYPATQPR